MSIEGSARILLSYSTTFQTECGVLTSADALDFIEFLSIRDTYPDGETRYPLAVVYTESMEVTPYLPYNPTGYVKMRIQFARDHRQNLSETYDVARTKFESILKEMMAASAHSELQVLVAGRIEMERTYVEAEEDRDTIGPHFSTEYTINYGVQR